MIRSRLKRCLCWTVGQAGSNNNYVSVSSTNLYIEKKSYGE